MLRTWTNSPKPALPHATCCCKRPLPSDLAISILDGYHALCARLGNAPSLAEGISSISLNPDAAVPTALRVTAAEHAHPQEMATVPSSALMRE